MDPIPATTPTSTDRPSYISNPFALLWEGFRVLNVNVGPLILIMVAFFVLALPIIAAYLSFVLYRSSSTEIAIGLAIVSIVLFFTYGVRLAAMLIILYLADAQSRKMSFRDLYTLSKPYAWRLLGLSILVGLVTLLGFIVFIIPGLLFLLWYANASFVLIDQDCSITEAMSRSKKLSHHHGWEIYGFYFAISLINSLSSIPLIGSVVSTIIGFVTGTGGAIRYLQLRDHLNSGEPTGPISGWNYAAFIIGIILVIAFVVLISVIIMFAISRP